MKQLLSGKLVFVVVAVVGLLAGAATAYIILPRLSSFTTPASAHGAVATPTEVPKAKSSHSAPGMIYAMKERVFNLADNGGLQYAKLELALEFDVPDAKGLKGEAYKKRQDEFVKEMAGRRPLMEDILTTTVSTKSSDQLVQQEGKEKLREELKARLGEAAGEFKLMNVYYTQFIIQ